MADRYDKLAPKDLIITLRSLRRRFDSVADAALSDPDLLPRIDEVGPSGSSLGQLVDGVAKDLQVLGTAVEAIVGRTEPEVDVSAIDPASARSGDRLTLDKAARAVGDRAEAMADQLDDVEADGWARTAAVRSGEQSSVDLVSVVRQATRSGIEGLRAAEQQLAQLR